MAGAVLRGSVHGCSMEDLRDRGMGTSGTGGLMIRGELVIILVNMLGPLKGDDRTWYEGEGLLLLLGWMEAPER